MTRFELELSGKLGDFWKRNAEQRITEMQKSADNGEILLDGNAAAYWERSGHYLPEECVEILNHCVFFFDAEATAKARDDETARDLEIYLRNQHEPTEEELFEMRSAFGEGAEIVDVITGKRIVL